MRLGDLLEGLSYEVIQGNTDIEITGIKDDSRKVDKGDAFFCVRGNHSDGHTYAAAVSCRAAALLVEREVCVPGGVTVVRFPDIRYAMGIISSRYYGNPSDRLTVIGITGTKGKTTTAYMIYSMLNHAGYKSGLIGTICIDDCDCCINSTHTTPESIDIHRYLYTMVKNGARAVVMEVSSQGLMLGRVSGISFDYGIYTNLSRDHIGPAEHKSFEHYRQCKEKLFSMCRVGIINIDDPYAEHMIEHSKCEIVTYGTDPVADYRVYNPKRFTENGRLGVAYNMSGRVNGEISVGMPGEFSVYNSAAAAALVTELGLGISVEEMGESLKNIIVKGRVEMVGISDVFTLIIDYAHNAMALEKLLEALIPYRKNRIISVFGCGGNRSRERRFEMGKVSARLSDETVITTDNPRYEEPMAIIADIKSGVDDIGGLVTVIPDRKEAIRYAVTNAACGDIIVLAGKGHETYQDLCGVKYDMDERKLIKEILEEEDVTKICGYNNRYFA